VDLVALRLEDPEVHHRVEDLREELGLPSGRQEDDDLVVWLFRMVGKSTHHRWHLLLNASDQVGLRNLVRRDFLVADRVDHLVLPLARTPQRVLSDRVDLLRERRGE